jgi:hypothetical protein
MGNGAHLNTGRFILLFGIVNATLYSALLPLWEGFDEAFHYGYVETLSQTRTLPVLGHTRQPAEIDESFRLTPLSHIVQRRIPNTISFDDWFRLSPAEKSQRRAALDAIRPHGDGPVLNYEAQQSPLAYAILALVDWPVSNLPITTRILILRLIAANCAIVLVFLGARSLSHALNVAEPYAAAAIFTALCSQMLYATTAHVANDWLAVGISAMFFAALARFVHGPDRSSAMHLAGWLAAGLLAKAYFLAFAFLAVAIALWLLLSKKIRPTLLIAPAILVAVIAGPWYARNLALYGNISGTLEQFHGIGVRQALAAAPHINWISTAGFLARGALWTGNHSFTTYSRTTLNLVLALLALGMAAWCTRSKSITTPERDVLTGIVLFSGALGYACCAAFADAKGETLGVGPWYTQVLLVPVLILVFLGWSRWGRPGSLLAAVTTSLWTWIWITTLTVKLVPMYSGAGTSPMRIADVWTWYTHPAARHANDLSMLALAPATFLYAGMLISAILAVYLAVVLIRQMLA